MRLKFKLSKYRILYNYFWFLALINIFFSTANIYASTFNINDIEVSTPFELNFSKKEIIDRGFVLAFNRLSKSITKTDDQAKIKEISLDKIKTMIETFSVKEEKFINDIYYLSLNVSFNKDKIFNLLENRNIFPSLPIKKDVLFIPIIIDEAKNEILIYSDNLIFKKWNIDRPKYHLLNYILPTEDLEDLSIIKMNLKNLETYNFNEIIKKYNLEDYIVMIIFQNENSLRVLNKINFNETMIVKNLKLLDQNFDEENKINIFIDQFKTMYENYWKSKNQMNTSVKLPIMISISNDDDSKVSEFEKTIENLDFLYNFKIFKFNNKSIIYKIIFNGSPENFLKTMKKNNYDFDTQNKIWIIK